MSELDALGVVHGTDKCSTVSWAWDYLRQYEALFGGWRDEALNIIEIGVLGGGSLRMWREYFRHATIVGIDIDPRCRDQAGERIEVRVGSQDDPVFLRSVTEEFPPGIIIDDGSHLAHHMIAAFEALFPELLPGGIYVFEDLSFHFEDGVGQWQGARVHQGTAALPIYDYLSPFIRARAANLAAPRDAWGFARYAFEQIDSITLFGGVLAIGKRGARDMDSAQAVFEAKLVQNGQEMWLAERYVEYLDRHGGDFGRAAATLRGGVATPAVRHALALMAARQSPPVASG